MNTRMIGFLLGRILMVEAGLLALPLLVSVLYHERCAWAVLASMAAAADGMASPRGAPPARRRISAASSKTGKYFASRKVFSHFCQNLCPESAHFPHFRGFPFGAEHATIIG